MPQRGYALLIICPLSVRFAGSLDDCRRPIGPQAAIRYKGASKNLVPPTLGKITAS